MNKYEQKFLKIISAHNPVLSDLTKEYSNTTNKLMEEIRFADTLNQKGWDELYEKCKNNVYAVYAISLQKFIPQNILHQLIYDDKLMSAYHTVHEANLISKIHLNIISRNDVKPNDIIHLCNINPSIIKELEKLVPDECDIRDCEDFPNIKDKCKIPIKNIETMNDIYFCSSSKFKWKEMPLRFIYKNGDIETLLKDLENGKYTEKQAEQIYAAIANNTNIAFDYREIAAENTDINNLFFVTKNTKEMVYQTLIESYYGTEINPIKVKTKGMKPSEIEEDAFNKTKKVLIQKIKAGFFTEAQEFDMINRARDIHNGKYKDFVLSTLLTNTKSKGVIAVGNNMEQTPSVEVLYLNPYTPAEYKQRYIEDIKNNLPTNKSDLLKKFKASSKRHEVIEHIIKTTPLQKDIKDKTLYKDFLAIIKPVECAESVYTPNDVLNELIEREDERFTKFYNNEIIEYDMNTINKKTYLHGQLQQIMRNNGFLKEEINGFMDGFKNLCVYNVLLWNKRWGGQHCFAPDPHFLNIKKSLIQMKDILKITKTLFYLPDKKRNNFLQSIHILMNMYKKDQPQYIMLNETLNVIKYAIKMQRPYFFKNMENLTRKEIESIRNVFVNEFFDNLSEKNREDETVDICIDFYQKISDELETFEICEKALEEIEENITLDNIIEDRY